MASRKQSDFSVVLCGEECAGPDTTVFEDDLKWPCALLVGMLAGDAFSVLLGDVLVLQLLLSPCPSACHRGAGLTDLVVHFPFLLHRALMSGEGLSSMIIWILSQQEF